MSVGVVIPAAGTGKRMQSAEKKQFLLLEGEPILLHTLRVFDTHPEIDQIVIVTREEEIDRTSRLVKKAGLKKVSPIVPGGEERQQSVYQGLICLDKEWVLVHDAVRPFVTHQLITRLLEAVYQYQAVIPAVPVKSTIKEISENGAVENTPKRKKLWSVQTPQTFQTKLLIDAFHQADDLVATATDDSMLVERAGTKVRVVEGDYQNIKITTPDDLVLANAFLEMRRRKREDRSGV